MKHKTLIASVLALLTAGLGAVKAQSIQEFTWVTNASQTIAITGFSGSESSVTIPSQITGLTVTTIEPEAFQDDVDMYNVTIPTSITDIETNAFDGCGSLEDVIIPASVTNIGIGAFRDCFHVQAIDVNASNPYYTGPSGVLFNKSMTTLIEFPEYGPTSYTIPNGVTNIEAEAFWGCSLLVTVTNASSVVTIGDTAFIGCDDLTGAYFLGNAPKTGLDVFTDDTDAKAYYYSGAKGWGSTFAGIPTVKLAVTLPSGSVQVDLTPAGAIAAGAKWQVDHGANETSGVTVRDISVGSHIISFSTISKWSTPTNQTISVTNGQTNRILGTYVYDGKGDPKLVITSPKAGQIFSNSSVAFTGTASDIAALNGVYFSLNNGRWTLASPSLSDSWSNWTAIVFPAAGTNAIRAYATDTTGSFSPTNTVAFKYIPSATLTVAANGLGSISPVDDDKLLAIGTNYTLTAVPGRNYIFSNWVASGGASFVSNNPVLKFTMRQNLVLTANFVTNVFLAGQGNYIGLFAPSGAAREQTNSGAFTFSVTSTGKVSGKLTIGTNTPSFSGQFDPGGTAVMAVPRRGLSTLTNLLQLDFADQSVLGTVSDGAFTADLEGDQEVFSGSHPATNYEGHYTLVVNATSNPELGPPAFSYGTATVSANGAVAFNGSLADGTTVSEASFVSKDGHWPFYLPLYNGNGSFWCSNILAGQTTDATAGASWINATNASKTALYSSGFTNQNAILSSVFYTPSVPLSTNLTLHFMGGNLPSPFPIGITVASNDTFKLDTSSEETNKLSMTISKSTGAISGHFANPANSKQTFTFGGVILQLSPSDIFVDGYFRGTNQSGVFTTQEP